MTTCLDEMPGDLPAWLAYLEKLHPKGQAGIELGLTRAQKVSTVLQQKPFCPILTVAGTNGKGSTVAYLESVLTAAGYKVGCYTSPHLLHYNERVRIKGQPVSDQALCSAFSRVESARQTAEHTFLTYFEFGTLAAWEVFAAEACEVLILEIGLGGRLDAVNLYPPDIALITTIALDHTDWLGPDRESIGFEKAGIFRHRQPALCADGSPPQSLLHHAEELEVPLQLIGRDFSFQQDPDNRFQWRYWGKTVSGEMVRRTLAYPGLRGDTQLRNAALAMAALDTLGPRLPVTMQAIREGLIQTELPGRFQVLPGRPAIVLDVGHNPQAIQTLSRNISSMGFFEKTHAVVGMLADKDITGTISQLRGRITHWFLAGLEGPRGLDAEALATLVAQADPDTPLSTYKDPEAALAAAQKQTGENDRIVVFGSFYTVAGVLKALGRG